MLQAVPVSQAPVDTVDLGAQLRTLYDTHYRSLVKLASFYVDDVWTCEEVVQDAFVHLLAGRRLTAIGTEAAYLRSAVLNGARSTLRKRKVRREKRPATPGPFPSAEPAALNLVVRDEILEALRALPRRQSDVLVLRYYLDLSEADIAETLGVARGTVKSHAHRGLNSLSDLLENLR